MRTLKTMSEMDARTDAGERGVAATLKRLADRLPACTQELCSSEVRMFVFVVFIGHMIDETGQNDGWLSIVSHDKCVYRI